LDVTKSTKGTSCVRMLTVLTMTLDIQSIPVCSMIAMFPIKSIMPLPLLGSVQLVTELFGSCFDLAPFSNLVDSLPVAVAAAAAVAEPVPGSCRPAAAAASAETGARWIARGTAVAPPPTPKRPEASDSDAEGC
jgi:hypothetical protein